MWPIRRLYIPHVAYKKALFTGGQTVRAPHGGRHHQQSQGQIQVSISTALLLLLFLLLLLILVSQAHLSHTVHGVPEGKRRRRGLRDPVGRAPGVRQQI